MIKNITSVQSGYLMCREKKKCSYISFSPNLTKQAVISVKVISFLLIQYTRLTFITYQCITMYYLYT